MILKVNLYWSWNGPGCTQKHHGTHESLWKAIFSSYKESLRNLGVIQIHISHFYICTFISNYWQISGYILYQLLMYVVVLNNMYNFCNTFINSRTFIEKAFQQKYNMLQYHSKEIKFWFEKLGRGALLLPTS